MLRRRLLQKRLGGRSLAPVLNGVAGLGEIDEKRLQEYESSLLEIPTDEEKDYYLGLGYDEAFRKMMMTWGVVSFLTCPFLIFSFTFICIYLFLLFLTSQAQGALASFCRYAGEEHVRSKKAQSVLNEAESKDAELERLKGEMKTLQATLQSDQATLAKVRSSLVKVESERDSAALQISSIQGELDRVKQESEARLEGQKTILDEFRLLEEYEDEVARKAAKMVHKTWERAVDYLMMNPNGDWAGFSEEFLRLEELEMDAEEENPQEADPAAANPDSPPPAS